MKKCSFFFVGERSCVYLAETYYRKTFCVCLRTVRVFFGDYVQFRSQNIHLQLMIKRLLEKPKYITLVQQLPLVEYKHKTRNKQLCKHSHPVLVLHPWSLLRWALQLQLQIHSEKLEGIGVRNNWTQNQ